jgi:hypothetical protein
VLLGRSGISLPQRYGNLPMYLVFFIEPSSPD